MSDKIKLLIFDLDGVLVDSRQLHFETLNRALECVNSRYIITPEEHSSRYDGRSTSVKLQMLTEEKGLPESLHHFVWKKKQNITFQVIGEKIKRDERLISILKQLKEEGYLLYCASNAIWNTIKMMLTQTGLIDFIDFFISNEDVSRTKPNPEIYLKSLCRSGVSPRETLILEDSEIGRKAALLSGSHLCPIIDSLDVTYEKIHKYIDQAEKYNCSHSINTLMTVRNLKIVIPMAGLGSRFAKAGYTLPKPLIDVCGKPMIQRVVENLNIDAHFIFICQKEHCEKYNLKAFLRVMAPGCDVVELDGLTQGAACSILVAKHLINDDNSLLFANSDQFVSNFDSSAFLYESLSDVDGSLLTFKANDIKWSYARLGEDGLVCEVAEKKVISEHATVGIYFWKHGSDFVKYAERMISKNIRINNEFYLVPSFQQAIEDGKKFKIIECTENIKMWGLGVPEDLENFIVYYDKD